MLQNIPKESRAHLLHTEAWNQAKAVRVLRIRNLVNNLQSKFSCSIL